jgi:hypothetical protein
VPRDLKYQKSTYVSAVHVIFKFVGIQQYTILPCFPAFWLFCRIISFIEYHIILLLYYYIIYYYCSMHVLDNAYIIIIIIYYYYYHHHHCTNHDRIYHQFKVQFVQIISFQLYHFVNNNNNDNDNDTSTRTITLQQQR